MPSPGSRVAWWDGDALQLGVVLAEEGPRLRLLVPGGRERRVPGGRVAVVIDRLPEPPAGDRARRAAAAGLDALAARVDRATEDVDVAVLWEVANDGESVPDLDVLAQLALGDDDGTSRAAVIRALIADGIHFVRRGTGWEARAGAAVEALRLERERIAARGDARRALVGALRDALRGRTFDLPDGNESRRALAALLDLAVRREGADARRRRAAVEVLDAVGVPCLRPEEGAFRLLRAVGTFASDDENLEIRRYGLRTAFPDDVERAARVAAARTVAADDRVDLTHLDVITIDGPRTREIDDGLSAETLPGGDVRLGIHIADPAAVVEPGDPIDREAEMRAATHYFPDSRLPMLPPVLSEDAVCLRPGAVRAAVSFLVDLDERGVATRWRVVRSRVRSRARLDYAEADRTLGAGAGEGFDTLRRIRDLARHREQVRAASGAVLLFAPEVDVWVDDAGRPGLEPIDPDSPSRRAVSEAMILAGELAARLCLQAGIDVIYRRQPAPPEPPASVPDGVRDPVAVRECRRRLRRGEASAEPGPHFALGLEAYVQVTSPLRRYQDLVAHRQITASIAGSPPPYDHDAVQRIAATTERAEEDGRRAESAARRYWLLRWLEERAGQTLDATVVEVEPRPVVQLADTLLEQAVPGLAGVEPGENVRVRVERVSPRADVLVLRGPAAK